MAERPKRNPSLRVLLVSANREHFPEPVFPLGTAYVASSLIRSGKEVRIFDAGIHTFPLLGLKRELLRFNPHVVGLSLRNIDNASYPHTRFYMPFYQSLVRTIRSVTSARILLGGSAFSIFPSEMMDILGAEAGIRGDGATCISSVLDEDCYGIRTCHESIIDYIRFPEEIDGVFPGFRRYRTIGVQTAKGCPHQCLYCTYPVIEGRGVQTRPAEMVAEEISMIKEKFGKRDFFIVDSTFNAEEKHMEEVLNRIIDRGIKIRFSCYMEPKLSDPSIFELLARAGCVAVDFGTDSGSPDMLVSMKKGFTVHDIKEASQWCRRAGIDFCHSLIFGGPEESEETLKDTVRLMDETAPKAVISMTGVRVYPGTGMEKISQGDRLSVKGESLLEPTFYFGGWDPPHLVKEVYRATSSRKNWFFPGKRDWSSALGPRLLRLAYRNGPLWRTFKS
jgi:radical SAM superfamily enzyme YgiQ (UPF0313 family)